MVHIIHIEPKYMVRTRYNNVQIIEGHKGPRRKIRYSRAGVRLSARWVSPLYLQTDLKGKRGKLSWAKRKGEVARTKQLDFESNLRQRLDEIRRFLRRNMPTIPPEHVQTIGPVRPA